MPPQTTPKRTLPASYNPAGGFPPPHPPGAKKDMPLRYWITPTKSIYGSNENKEAE